MEVLKGIRILDLTRLLPGPFCTQMLGDLGAEVIKIEETGEGDYIRSYPPWGKSESSLFIALNRNKKSMTLNLRSEEGQSVFRKMILTTDIVIEQFRPGMMVKLGLGYDHLKLLNPGIIMCSISGYGQTGKYKDVAGHDINYLSTAGILDIIGNFQGSPVIPGIQIADVGGGSLWAAFSIMTAIFAREKTGLGQYIDVSMTDTVFTYAAMLAGAFFTNHKVPRRAEELLNGGYAWYNVYRTKDDRYISIGMLENKFWSKFCETIGREDLIKQQFAPVNIQREMIRDLGRIFTSRNCSEWMEILGPLDICVTRVNNLSEAINDVHFKERGLIKEIDHSVEGKINTIGFPIKFSDINCSVLSPPPVVGQHTEELLLEFGYTQEQITALKEKQVI